MGKVFPRAPSPGRGNSAHVSQRKFVSKDSLHIYAVQKSQVSQPPGEASGKQCSDISLLASPDILNTGHQ